MYVYVISYVMYADLKPFKGVSTSDVINGETNNQNNYRYQQSIVTRRRPAADDYGFETGSYPNTGHKGRYGIDKFRVSWHMNIPPSGPLPVWGFLEEPFPLSTITSVAPPPCLDPQPTQPQSSDSASPTTMVVAPKESKSVPVPIPIDRAAETVSVVERPGYQQATVSSELFYSDNRRHKEQVDFRPVLHPVKYSDTAYVWINSTRRRFVSRTYYEPRVRPRAYSDTTFVRPKIAEQHFVSCLDIHADAKRKWFKTSVEIKPRKFTSSKVIRSPNNNYIGTDTTSTTTTATTTDLPNGTGSDEYNHQNNNNDNPPVFDRLAAENGAPNGFDGQTSESSEANGFAERLDPGASQVYIPKQLMQPLDENCLTNGDILVNLLPNGHYMDR